MTLAVYWGPVGAEPEINKEKLAQVKKVAVASIYGPPKILATSEHFDQLETYNYTEQALAARLPKLQWQIVPAADTKKFLSENYKAAYLEFVRPEHKQYVKDNPAVVENYLQMREQGLFSGGPLTWSSNTTKLVDYYTGHEPNKAPPATETFRQAMAKLAKQLGTDAFLVVRVIPGWKSPKWGNSAYGPANSMMGALAVGLEAMEKLNTAMDGDKAFAVVHTRLINSEGEIVFEDEVTTFSNEGYGTGGMNFSVGEADVSRLMHQAIDNALDQVVKDAGGS